MSFQLDLETPPLDDAIVEQGAANEQTHIEVPGGQAGETSSLPLIEACLNGAATVLLIAGVSAIHKGKRGLHERLMLLAFLASSAFLAIYLYYHFAVQPALGARKFNGEGFAKSAYLVLLVTHVVGAIVNLPMVLRTFYLAWKERWEDHKRWAKFTFPLWLYVSVTGVIVYLVLYPFNPAA